MNSVYRIAEILKIAQAQKPDIEIFEAWANTFGLPNAQDSHERKMEVLDFLSLLHAEWKLLREQLYQAENLPPTLFEPTLIVLKDILASTGALGSQWGPYKSKINPNFLRELAWCGNTLGQKTKEEEAIPKEELQKFLKEINELRKHIIESSLSDPVKTVVLHHLDLIERAIFNYPIIGAKAFKNAVVVGTGEFILEKEAFYPSELNQEQNRPIKELFKNAWGRAVKYSRKIPKAYLAVKMGEDAREKINQVIEFFGQ